MAVAGPPQTQPRSSVATPPTFHPPHSHTHAREGRVNVFNDTTRSSLAMLLDDQCPRSNSREILLHSDVVYGLATGTRAQLPTEASALASAAQRQQSARL
eukprot:912020-Prorocentrum_minimum.AAC.5